MLREGLCRICTKLAIFMLLLHGIQDIVICRTAGTIVMSCIRPVYIKNVNNELEMLDFRKLFFCVKING